MIGLAAGGACALALPACRHHAHASQAHYTRSGGTITDNATKLHWQRAVAPGSYTWNEAQKYCASLSLAGHGWRVPSVKELMTLVDVSVNFSVPQAGPTIDAKAFPATPPASFWSSSRLAGVFVHAESRAWYVDFGDGGAAYDAVTKKYRVRCVR